MAPAADAVVAAVLVPALGHLAGAVADLDLKAGGRRDVEAEHTVVRVVAEAAGDVLAVGDTDGVGADDGVGDTAGNAVGWAVRDSTAVSST